MEDRTVEVTVELDPGDEVEFAVYGNIVEERRYQQAKWGNAADEQVNCPTDFVAYIAKYSTSWMAGGFKPYSRETLENFRKSMVKVAAVAVAAARATDLVLAGCVHRPDYFDEAAPGREQGPGEPPEC